jgi:hypothetical protein
MATRRTALDILRKPLSWLAFCAALAWSVVISVMLGQIYLNRGVPWHSLTEWGVDVQLADTGPYIPMPFEHHSRSFYVARFYSITFVVLILGVVAFRSLRRAKTIGQKRNYSSGGED